MNTWPKRFSDGCAGEPRLKPPRNAPTSAPPITLQNTPNRKGAIARSVSFNSHGNTLQGTLYLPDTATAPFPAVVVTGAWTTVKEQMADPCARELAARGHAALAFDFTGWGQSEGTPR